MTEFPWLRKPFDEAARCAQSRPALQPRLNFKKKRLYLHTKQTARNKLERRSRGTQRVGFAHGKAKDRHEEWHIPCVAGELSVVACSSLAP